MSQELCRLCLGSERLICTFDTRLSNAQELRMCVLLSTGVEIESTDLVTKMVCRNCLEVALKLVQFRTTAIANDKALKEQIGQEYVMPLSDTQNIAELHKGILDGMSHINVDESIEQISKYITENDATKTKSATESSADCKNFHNNQSTVEFQLRIEADDQSILEENKTDSPDTRVNPTETPAPESINRQVFDGETHLSVKKLFQIYPNLVLTDDVQNENVTPSLILDKSEANKYLDQLQYYTETEEENTSSLNEQYYNFNGNLECSKNVENTERNALAKLNLHRDSHHKFYRTDYRSNYYVDPDYYVFKTRKRKYDDISDESCSDWDTGESDLETDELAQRTAEMITRSSKYKFPRTSYTNSDSDSEFLGFSKANEEVRVCEYCDKICYSRSQLRHHERTHRKCQVCHKIFRTDEALSLHLRNVCYRRIEENQPFLHILRVDDHPLVVKQYQEAFDYFFSRMNDESYEGYGKRDENISLDENFPLYHTEEHIANENVYILDIFKKFQSIQNVPVRRNKMSQTRKSDIIIKYSNQNQIILQDLFSDLLTYKVPIQMVVDQKISAHISYTTKPTQNKTMHDWSDTCAINVATQPKLLNLTSALPSLHFFNPTSSVLKTVTNKNLSSIRPKVVHKNKGGSVTKTVASNANVKVVSNSGSTKPVMTSVITSANQQQIHNITRILTAITTNPQTQTYTVTKTTVNETPAHLQPNTVSIKHEEPSEPLNTCTTVAGQPNQATAYNTNINLPRQNIIFKIPYNPSKQNNRCESLIKEEILDGINESISKHVAALEHPNNTKRPVFRFPYNTQNQHQLYQNTNQNVNSSMYPPQNVRLQSRNQYLIPVTSMNSQHSPNSDQNGLRNISLNNLLLLKNPGAPNLNSPNLPSPSHVINGNVFFPSRNSPIPSPINSTPSPIPSKISSPINTVAPFFTSNADSLNANSYSSNSYSASKTPLPYPPLNSYQVPENSVAYDTDPFPPPINNTNAFPSENPYNANPYSPSDAYSSNGFRSNSSSYSPSSFQSSDAYASNYSQYIPPYNPMSEYGYNDGHSMQHMLPPQHVNTNAGGGKVFLRVKQPWELNQK